jgi:hypothetical protein
VYIDFKGATSESQAIAAACAQTGLHHISPLELDWFVDAFEAFLKSLRKGSIVVFDNLLVDHPNGLLGTDSNVPRENLNSFIQKAVIALGRKLTYTHCIGQYVCPDYILLCARYASVLTCVVMSMATTANTCIAWLHFSSHIVT